MKNMKFNLSQIVTKNVFTYYKFKKMNGKLNCENMITTIRHGYPRYGKKTIGRIDHFYGNIVRRNSTKIKYRLLLNTTYHETVS